MVGNVARRGRPLGSHARGQGLVAFIFLFRGAVHPWLAAAPWWTVYGTLIDAGCLALIWKFTRDEGIRLRDVIGPIRWRSGRDFFLGVGVFAVVFPCFVVGGLLSALAVYGTSQPSIFPGILSARVLPHWAVIYSFSLWWVIWSTTEEMTYAGFALPRAQALSRRTWMAVVLVGFWWAIQHSFLPFVPEWRNFVSRFLGVYPGRRCFSSDLFAYAAPSPTDCGALGNGHYRYGDDHALMGVLQTQRSIIPFRSCACLRNLFIRGELCENFCLPFCCVLHHCASPKLLHHLTRRPSLPTYSVTKSTPTSSITWRTTTRPNSTCIISAGTPSAQPTPVVIVIHGGGWIAGTKEERVLEVLPYFQMGFAAVNVEYRMAQVSLAPAAVEDCRCALHWVFANAKRYNFDPSRVVSRADRPEDIWRS